MQERMTALESNCKIELVNVTKRFGKVIANDSVNLTIEAARSCASSEKTEAARPR